MWYQNQIEMKLNQWKSENKIKWIMNNNLKGFVLLALRTQTFGNLGGMTLPVSQGGIIQLHHHQNFMISWNFEFLLNNISIFRDIVRARPNAGLYIANCPFHVSRYKWVLTISNWHVHEIIISLSFWFESYVWWRGITEFDMIYMVRCAVRKRIEECHKTESTFKHTHWSVKKP